MIRPISFSILILLLFSGIASGLFAQDATPIVRKYLVLFKDKDLERWSPHRPWEFLSARALERRARYGLPIEFSDIPVDETALRTLSEAGATIHNTTKWLNGAQIICSESLLPSLASLPFVETIHYVGGHKDRKRAKPASSLKSGDQEMYENAYGLGALQISMTNGHVLHQLGFRGESVWVQVQDGGFSSVHLMSVFDSLRGEGRLFEGYDFIESDREVFESSSHGSQVLSVMAANRPGVMIGTAPDATYVLSKTEDTKGESHVEELNWIAAAEYADSLGVDVINSSLGYTTFNDTSLNWTYADMDGRTTWATRGAEMAFAKGMMVVNSAGNEGTSEWRYIGSPADGPNVLAVGAVGWDGERAPFSSGGPSADGRIKPNVAAPGNGVVVASTEADELTLSAGTSFAAPLVAGLVTTLWQAFPERSNAEIMEALELTASQADNPDTILGYGIPDMLAAFQFLNDRYVILTDRSPDAITQFRRPVVILPADTFEEGGVIYLHGSTGNILDKVTTPAPSGSKGLHISLDPRLTSPPYFIRILPHQ